MMSKRLPPSVSTVFSSASRSFAAFCCAALYSISRFSCQRDQSVQPEISATIRITIEPYRQILCAILLELGSRLFSPSNLGPAHFILSFDAIAEICDAISPKNSRTWFPHISAITCLPLKRLRTEKLRSAVMKGDSMRRFAILLALGVCCLLIPASADEEPLQGFTRDSSTMERQWEVKFRAIPSPQNQRDYMQRLSARPHNVGTAYDKENAEWILSQYKLWGWDAHIEAFDVLYPTPKERVLEMVAPTKFVAKLQEPPVAEDPTSSQQNEQLPSYNAYSIDGDVTAPLVYVNYGIPADYEELDRLGISVKGAIVIARYGGSWRGIKPKVAGEHGAVGCLIYSDPRDDGYAAGDTFPAGPFRPSDGAQRGSVMDMPVYPGDPLTPGVGATKDAKRLPLNEVTTLTKIPTLPISYGDAQPLLAALHGPVAPVSWRGALPITYHMGPGPAKVHLKLAFNWDLK